MPAGKKDKKKSGGARSLRDKLAAAFTEMRGKSAATCKECGKKGGSCECQKA